MLLFLNKRPSCDICHDCVHGTKLWTADNEALVGCANLIELPAEGGLVCLSRKALSGVDDVPLEFGDEPEDDTPVYIRGKSAFVRQYAQEVGLPVLEMKAVKLTVDELAGAPALKDWAESHQDPPEGLPVDVGPDPTDKWFV